MKRLLPYITGYKKEAILAPLFKMLEASFELLIPIVVKRIVDIGIANGDKGYVLRMCLLMVALGLIGLVCSVIAQYYSAKAAVGAATKLRHTMFSHLQSFSYTQMDKLGVSKMITRLTGDINQVQNGINMVLRLFLRSPFIVIGAMVMAFITDPKSAIIFAIVIPLLAIVVFGIMLITIPMYQRVQGGVDKILRIVRGNLTGVRVIRAFQKEEEETLEFEESSDALAKMQIAVGRLSAVMNPVTYVLVNGATVLLLWVGAVRVDAGILTQGAVMALVNYMSQILVELIKLANLIITINKALACNSRVFDMMEIQPDMVGGEGSEGIENSPWSVEFSKVGLRYPEAGEESLKDIDFRVRQGEMVGIIGGTGSGKTSLINLIPRFYEATAGEIKVEGTLVQDYSLEGLRKKVGVVPQKTVLFKGTLKENMLMGKENAQEEEIWKALEIAQALDFIKDKGEGLDMSIAQGGKNLSGGQRQRLTIARALVREPKILILDDSASALDFATDAKLREAIRQQKDKMTVFIVSQRASSIMFADQIIVLDDGNIVGKGTHEELLVSCLVYQEIYYSQFPERRENV